MSEFITLLPYNSTPLERDIEKLTSRVGALPVPLRDIWNPDEAPEHLLPWLAWGFSVEVWDHTWSLEDKRNVLRDAVAVHRVRGTKQAVVRTLRLHGYGDAAVVERYGWDYYDGQVSRDGNTKRHPPDHWAEYRVTMARPISIDQADVVRRLIAAAAPVRSHLKHLDFSEASLVYNGRYERDGTYTRGIV